MWPGKRRVGQEVPTAKTKAPRNRGLSLGARLWEPMEVSAPTTRGGVTVSPACRRQVESAVAVAVSVAVAVAWPAALRHPKRTRASSLVRPPVSARLAPSGPEPSAVHRLEMCTRRRDTLAQGDDSARLEFHCPMSLNVSLLFARRPDC
jgi:hypothetical protein